jgi:hypothetical protein
MSQTSNNTKIMKFKFECLTSSAGFWTQNGAKGKLSVSNKVSDIKSTKTFK